LDYRREPIAIPRVISGPLKNVSRVIEVYKRVTESWRKDEDADRQQHHDDTYHSRTGLKFRHVSSYFPACVQVHDGALFLGLLELACELAGSPLHAPHFLTCRI